MALTRYIEIKVESSKAKSSVDSLDKSMVNLGGSTDSAALKLSSLAKAIASVLAAGAISKALLDAANAAKDFNASLSNLSAITGATGRDLEFLRQTALEFGATTTLSASEAVNALKLVASAKPDLLESGEALKEVTRQAILLAEASGVDLASAAATVGKALNQFGEDADQAARFVNVLAAGAKFGASEIADTSEALKNAGVAASSAGVSFEQTNAAIQVLAATGIQGAEAGTALRNVFLKLDNGLDQSLRPSIVGLEAALDNLNKKNLSGAELVKMFGLENIVAAQTLLKSSEQVGILEGKLTGTNTALEQATTNTDNWAGDLKALGSAIESVQIQFGNLADGDLRNITQAVTGLVQAVGGNKEALKEWGDLLTGVSNAAEALAIVLISKLIAAGSAYVIAQTKMNYAALQGSITTNDYGQVIARTTVATNLAAVASNGLRTALALLGGPVGILVIAAGSLYAFREEMETSKEQASRLSDEIDTLSASYKDLNEQQRYVAVAKVNTEMESLRKKLITVNEELASIGDPLQASPRSLPQIERLKDDADEINAKLSELSKKQQAIFAAGIPSIENTPTAPKEKPAIEADPIEASSTKTKAPDLADTDYSARYLQSQVNQTQATAQELENRLALYTEYTTKINQLEQGSFQQSLLMVEADSFAKSSAAKLNYTNKIAELEEERALLLDNDRLTAEARTELQIQLDEQKILAAQEYELLLTEIAEDGANSRNAITRAEWEAASAIVGSLGSSMVSAFSGQSRKMFEIGKALAISDTIINTYSSATKAYDAMASIPYIGPALGAAAAAAAIAGGLANVKRIQSQSFGGGSGAASSTYSSSGASSASSSSGAAASAPTQTTVFDFRSREGQFFTAQDVVDILGSVEGAVVINNSLGNASRIGEI